MSSLEEKQKLAMDLFNNTRILINEIYEISGLEDEVGIEEFYRYLENYRDEKGNKIEKRPNASVTQEYKDLVKELRAVRKEKIEAREEKIKQENLSKDRFIETVIYNMRCEGLSYRTISENLKKEFNLYISHETIRKICGIVFKEMDQNEEEVIAKLKQNKKSNIVTKKNEFTVGRNIYKYIPEDLLYEAKKHNLTYMEITNFLKTQGINVHPKTVSLRCNKVFAEKGESIPSIRKGLANCERRIRKQETVRDMVYQIAKKRKASQQQLEYFAQEASRMYKVKIDIEPDKER